ncbi:glycosyltransferase [Actinomyces polynesiensis]|uniref:glycosyltransferase n=1 Tax=Actinomyces polynesiensis TaxID=1325934 RepID=UPI0005B8296D|nr:glycosyltransferase [Actinomyces polynesiensis]
MRDLQPRPLRVLHVVESWGGGVQVAVLSYIASTPQYKHYLLYSTRASAENTHEDGGGFAGIQMMPRSPWAALRIIRSSVRTIRPDVMHLHSSFAGVLGRTAIRCDGTPIVYTPHCYAFERKVSPMILRAAYWLLEKSLAANTSVVAACSDREVWLARSLNSRVPTVMVPNRAEVPPADGPKREPNHERVVVASGRITRQKGPDFFAAASAASEQYGFGLTWRWLGGGSIREENELLEVSKSIELTGWISRRTLFDELQAANVYVHTAEWEGFPISLLEAHSARVPIIVRKIGAFVGAPPAWCVDTPEELVKKVVELMGSEAERKRNLSDWDEFLEGNTIERQGECLQAAYCSALLNSRKVPLKFRLES